MGEFRAHGRGRRAFLAVVGSKAPLSEACHADQGHVTRAFERAFGTPPGELRGPALDP